MAASSQQSPGKQLELKQMSPDISPVHMFHLGQQAELLSVETPKESLKAAPQLQIASTMMFHSSVKISSFLTEVWYMASCSGDTSSVIFKPDVIGQLPGHQPSGASPPPAGHML